MLSLDFIKNNFTPLDINNGPGEDKFVPELPIVERHNVALIVKHSKENKFLLAIWKKVNWNGFITGGIEDGESESETAVKELKEEAGYCNIRQIVVTDFTSHGLFYHVVKKQNRLAHYKLVYVELENEERLETGQEEKDIADFEFVREEEVLNKLTRDDMKNLWKYWQENKQ